MKNKKTIWLVLFAIYAAYTLSELILFGYFINNTQNGGFTPSLGLYIKEAIILIMLIGFYGYIKSKKILNIYFWRVLFISVVGYESYKIITTLQEHGYIYLNMFIEVWWSPLLVLAVIPAYVALYKYSFKSNKLWV